MEITKEVLKEFQTKYWWYGKQELAKGECINSCIEFLKFIGAPFGKFHQFMASNCSDPETNEFTEHHWVKIGNLNIDWTARQFGEDQQFPKIWRD